MKIIDLSAEIAPSSEDTPTFLRVDMDYNDHAHGAAQAQAILGVPPTVFRHREGWATERITNMGTHDVTHLDAPYHYNSVIQGQPAETIDQLPLEMFFNDGVLLDMTHKVDGDAVTVGDIEQALTAIEYELKANDIVLMHTGRDKFYGQPNYIFLGCGVTAVATHWLYEQGIRVMGIDAWGWDAPLQMQAQAALENGEPGVFWAAHQVDLPYVQIERLVNLASLPPIGFKVACFPLKIKGGSAGPARVVAILAE